MTVRSGCLLIFALVAAIGCSPGDAATGLSSPDAGTDGGSQSLTFTMAALVKPNTESYTCRLVAMPAEPVFALAFAHAYSAGSHHLFVFRTDLPTVPPGGDTEVDCFAGAPSPMSHTRATLYGAETREGRLVLPPGVGLPMKAGEVLLVEDHYLNATASPIDATASFTMETTTLDPDVHAGTFFFYDPFIDVAAGQLATASMRCAFPADATVLTTVGSGHARAVQFDAFVDPPAAPPATAPYYQAPGWTDPLPLETTLGVKGGSDLRFACAYDNRSGTVEYVQGPSANGSEECVLSGMYFPALGDDFDACRTSPGGFGTGRATCSASRACASACPPGSQPPAQFGLGGEPSVDPCWQRCVVASCATSDVFLALVSCVSSSCALECASAGTACATCTETHCSKESASCDSASCP